jgi:ADP-L-glycero-D-manno-heptose 6-epimerase
VIVVTGGAGFIGSNLVRRLLAEGRDEVAVVDYADAPGRALNLAGLAPALDLSPEDLLARLAEPAFARRVRGIAHQGACTDTLVQDARHMLERNVLYAEALLRHALAWGIPLVYASSAAVYGASPACRERPADEAPLNLYGVSKLAFDHLVRNARPGATLVGLRYFNVYGPGEAAKGPMASMVHQVRRQLEREGVARLFGATPGCGPGEQRRDFVFVGDVVDVNLHFLRGPVRHAILNVGTGKSRSFNDLAATACALLGRGRVEYIPFPDALRGRYQERTRADLRALRAAGYRRAFTPLERGMAATFRSEESPWTPA